MPIWAISAASRSAFPGWCSSCPALMLNYMGQGAMVLSQDDALATETLRNPFFLLAPEALRLPLVILATFATIIASQAVISGAFSVTQQAMQLGFIPRLRVQHTSERAIGQIYIPVVNWVLLVMVVILVLSFQNSSNLAAAYGIAVTGAMFIDTCLLAVVLFQLWQLEAVAGDPDPRALLPRRHRLFRREPHQGARRRLVPAAGRRCSPSPCSPPGRGAAS